MTKEQIRNNIGHNLRALFNMHHKSINSICLDLGLERTNLYYWLNRRYIPSWDWLSRLSEYFEVPVYYFFLQNETEDYDDLFRANKIHPPEFVVRYFEDR